MPTVLRVAGFRFYFYSHEPGEPPHVHVDKGGSTAKVWLQPIALARQIGFRGPEIATILSLAREHERQLLEAWHGYFG
jgi:hypothetical protein